MWTLADLIKNFFTHKDFLPSADKMPGTMFTPLHFAFSAVLIALIAVLVFLLRRMGERKLKIMFTVLWAFLVVAETVKIVWESTAGSTVRFEWGGLLPLYPCSIYMYAMPIAIWGKGVLRRAGCGYVCTLGLIGGAINFVYPANVLVNYSCISFAGLHTFVYHGVMVFTAAIMLASGYHSYKGVTRLHELVTPAIPALAVSIPANIVNFTIGSDYMFFRCTSFIFAPIGNALGAFAVLVVYIAYLIVHAMFYLPSYIANKRRQHSAAA